ncbi:integrase family protein [Sphingosinicella sp. LHD-64]|uniref:tyrosine-type recombinase/integrase n=1 Tax=Sphingosinicella sp. LHD-64 TaxID=3072139 RepID=UPI00280CF1E3|nr:integrase family protein [Sphingosinicella sp. LHD-64]MDQ8757366.1 integrase family protein [Sphingosinicella sp. LHD-64]
MTSTRITKTAVESAERDPERDTFYWDDKLAGFGIRVTPKGIRSYVVQYRLAGHPARRVTIGRHGNPWTAELARREATNILVGIRQGIDPIDAKREEARVAKTMRFDDYVTFFVENHLKLAWPSSWELAKRRLELYAVPHLKARPLPKVRKADIATILDPVRAQRGTARNLHAVLRLLFNWAVDRDDLAISPMHGLKAPPAPKARKRVLSPDEILALWWATFEVPVPYSHFVRLLICTLQRRNEVAGLPWEELNRGAAQWHLEGERAKNGVEHIIPLNALARIEFDQLGWRQVGLVFSTTGETPISGFSKWKTKIDEHMRQTLQHLADLRAIAAGERPHPVVLRHWVIHDIRRSGTTQMQALGIPIEVTEKCLNHISGETSGIRGVYNLYQYLPEKKAAFDAWGNFLERLIADGERLLVERLGARVDPVIPDRPARWAA